MKGLAEQQEAIHVKIEVPVGHTKCEVSSQAFSLTAKKENDNLFVYL
jgi:hypothetical protein